MARPRYECGPFEEQERTYRRVDTGLSISELLHDNVKKYGTVFNTVAPGTDLQGVLVRATSPQP